MVNFRPDFNPRPTRKRPTQKRPAPGLEDTSTDKARRPTQEPTNRSSEAESSRERTKDLRDTAESRQDRTEYLQNKTEYQASLLKQRGVKFNPPDTDK